MSKSLSLFVGIILLCFLLMNSTAQGRPSDDIRDRIPGLVPETPLIYFAMSEAEDNFNDFLDSDFWPSFSKSKAWQDFLRLRQWLRLQDKLRELERLVGFKFDRDNINKLLGDSTAIAIYGFPTVDFIFITKAGISRKVTEFLSRYQDRFESTKYNDLSLYIVQDEDKGIEAGYCSLDNLVIMGSNISRLKQAIDLYRGGGDSLLSDDNFKKVNEELKGEAEALAYLNMSELADNPYFTRYWYQRSSEHLEGMLGLGIKLNLDRGGLLEERYTLYKSEPPSLALLSGPTSKRKPSSLKLIPAEAVYYSSLTSLSPSSAWDRLLKRDEEEVAPRSAGDKLRRLEEAGKIDFLEDIAPWLGSEVGYALLITKIDSVLFYPQAVALLGVTDEDKAWEFMDKIRTPLGEVLTEDIAEDPEVAIEAKEREVVGQKVVYYPSPFGDIASPAYTVVDGFLVLSNSLEAIERIINTSKGRSRSLEGDKKYREVRSHFPDSFKRMNYLDVEKLLNIGAEFLEDLGNISNWTRYRSRQFFAENIKELTGIFEPVKAMGSSFSVEGKESRESRYYKIGD